MPRTVRTCGECGRVNPGHWRNCSQYPSTYPTPAPASPDPELERLLVEEEYNERLHQLGRAASNARYRIDPQRYRIDPNIITAVRESPWHDTPAYDDDGGRPGPRQERPRNPNMNFTFLNAITSPGPYAEYIGRARGFFSTYGDRRYSPNTLARLEQVADALRYGNDNITRPLLLVADNPVTFDPETESKSGGLAGMAVCWPMERTLVAVNRSVRQQGIGSNLLEQLSHQVGRGALTLWVGQSNVNGHRFCLSNGFIPTAMNGTGAVRYAVENSDV